MLSDFLDFRARKATSVSLVTRERKVLLAIAVPKVLLVQMDSKVLSALKEVLGHKAFLDFKASRAFKATLVSLEIRVHKARKASLEIKDRLAQLEIKAHLARKVFKVQLVSQVIRAALGHKAFKATSVISDLKEHKVSLVSQATKVSLETKVLKALKVL